MNTDILKNSSANNREINTDSLKIYGNCLEFKDTVVQLSNVSLIANNPLVPPQFPRWVVIIVFLGLFFLSLKEAGMVFFGLLLIGISGFIIYISI